MPVKKDSRLKRAGVSGFNKPKRTPSHPKKLKLKQLGLENKELVQQVNQKLVNLQG